MFSVAQGGAAAASSAASSSASVSRQLSHLELYDDDSSSASSLSVPRVSAPAVGDSEYRRSAQRYPSTRERQERYASLGEDIRKGNAKLVAHKNAGMTHEVTKTKVTHTRNSNAQTTRQIERHRTSVDRRVRACCAFVRLTSPR